MAVVLPLSLVPRKGFSRSQVLMQPRAESRKLASQRRDLLLERVEHYVGVLRVDFGPRYRNPSREPEYLPLERLHLWAIGAWMGSRTSS